MPYERNSFSFLITSSRCRLAPLLSRSGCQSDFQYRVCSEECTNSLIEIVVEADATRATAAEIGRLSTNEKGDTK